MTVSSPPDVSVESGGPVLMLYTECTYIVYKQWNKQPKTGGE